MIDEQEAALFKRAQDTSDQRLNLIQQRKESANNALAKASVYSETEPATTDKGVRFYKELSDKIAAVLKDGDDTINTPLPPEVHVDLVMKETATECIVQSIQSQFGHVVCLSQPAGPSDINVTGTGEKRAFVGMPSKFNLRLLLYSQQFIQAPVSTHLCMCHVSLSLVTIRWLVKSCVNAGERQRIR